MAVQCAENATVTTTNGYDTLNEYAVLTGLLVAAIVFITLIGLDTLKALKKGLYWIPADALVLTALTIQVLNLFNGQRVLFNQMLDNQLALEAEVVKNYLFMIHTSRVMLCVLVAYLLPGMARSGGEDSWGNLAALILSIFLHIPSDMFSVHRRLAGHGLYLHSKHYFWPHANKVTQTSFIVSDVIISVSLVWLIVLLSSAVIANKSIRDIIRQKIPKFLSWQSNGTDYSWETVEDQVLKSWIVARACYPEYIIARSVLTTSAATIITICISSSIIGWLVQGPIIRISGANSFFKFPATILEVVFCIIGWAIISCRSLTSLAYYGRWRRQKEERWCSFFMVEDFWTRHILELQETSFEKSQKRKVDERVSEMTVTEGMEICLPVILLRCVFWVQFLVVFLCKVCWFLSEIMFYNKLTLTVSSKLLLLLKHKKEMEEDGSGIETKLENVHILWETRESVLATNRKSIKQAEELRREGHMDGKNCGTLVKFLGNYISRGYVGLRCLDPGTQQHQTGLNFLCKRHPGPALEVEKHFAYASKGSWKLTAVSLINIIVRLSPQCGEESMRAYSEACDLMDLVEEADPETDNLLSKAADSLFKTLLERSKKINAPAKKFLATITMEQAAEAINKLAEESEQKAQVIGHGEDSLDWKKAAAGNALYKLCKSIDCRSGDFIELIDELQRALADIIGACIQKVGGALVYNCMKWAQDLDLQERKLLTAVYTAGKSKALMEELKWPPRV